MTNLMLFIFVFASSLAFAGEGTARLETKLYRGTLPLEAQEAVYQRILPQSRYHAKVEDLVKMRAKALRGIQNGLVLKEISDFLAPLGLRVGLNAEEIRWFRKYGSLPAPTLDSGVETLKVSQEAAIELEKLGIVLLEDADDLTIAEIQEKSNSALAEEIAVAFKTAGYPLAKDQNELKSRDENLRPILEAANIRTQTITALEEGGVYTLGQIRKLTRVELEEIPAVSAEKLAQVAGVLSPLGITLYDDVLDKATHEKSELNMEMLLAKHVRFLAYQKVGQPLLNALWLGDIRTIGDLKKILHTNYKLIGITARSGDREPRELARLLDRLETALNASCEKKLDQ